MAHYPNNNAHPVRSRMHPLVVAAIVSFIAVCGVGIAVLTGLLPSPMARTNDRPDVVALDREADAAAKEADEAVARANQAAAAAAAARGGNAPAPAPAAAPSTPVAAPQPVARAAAPGCSSCGVVTSVTSYKVKGEGTGLGAVAGGVLGGVVGNQFGGGNGRTALTLLGAGGGAYAGHEVEKNVRSSVRYQMKVRMEDGSVRTFTSASPFAWRSGDPVRVVNGKVVSRNEQGRVGTVGYQG